MNQALNHPIYYPNDVGASPQRAGPPPNRAAEYEQIAAEASQQLIQRLDRLVGVLERHQEGFDKYADHDVIAAAGLAAGTVLLNSRLSGNGIQAKSLIIDNPSGYYLYLPALDQIVPPGVYNLPIACFPALATLTLSVLSGSSAQATIHVRVVERVLPPVPALAGVAGGGSSGGTPAQQTGARVLLASPPASLTANAATALNFASKVNHWRFQNSSATTKWLAPDDTSANGYLLQVQPGQTWEEDAPLAALSVWSSTADSIATATASPAPTGVSLWGYA